MAAESTALTTRVSEGTPYALDLAQVTRAAEALARHVKTESERRESSKKDLLAGATADDEAGEDDESPTCWLIVTTKKAIVDKKILKPRAIPVPHSLYSSTQRICLITADPQREYKDIVVHPSFPTSLSARITRVIGVSKLRAKYKSFERQRQLRDEHDVFLADERIVTYLPPILGKTFYKSGTKRPIPVLLTGRERKAEGKANAEKKIGSNKNPRGGRTVANPQEVAKAIGNTLHKALVNLSPSNSTSIRAGKASWPASQISENIEAVIKGITEKTKDRGSIIPQGWRNIRAIHVKTPNSASLPVWLASELWLEEEDVLDEKWQPADKAITAAGDKDKKEKGSKKRKAEGSTKAEKEDKHIKKKVRSGVDEGVKAKDKEAKAERKERLRKQKAKVLGLDNGVADVKAKLVKA